MRVDFSAVYAEAAKSLGDAGVDFAVTGATALGAYTLPRATYDLDLIVGKTTVPLDQKLRGLHLVERTKDVFFDQDAFIFEVATYVTPIEMFVATHWLTSEALERRRIASVPGLGEVPAVRADDAALLKAAIAVHPARVHRRAVDVDDLRRLRDAAPDMDPERLRSASRKLGAPAMAALREAGFDV